MMENIERIHYFRDDQIPEIMHFRAIQKRFNPKDTKHGIVDVDGPNLVILDKESKYYLICHHPSREVLQQILELIEKISISMYMEVPLKNTESIINEEEFSPDESELELLKDPDWISKKENL